MAVLQRLRTQIGHAKYYYLQGGRKAGAYQREVGRVQDRTAPLLDRLPPLHIPVSTPIQVHLLCGHKQLQMGIWSLWSLCHFTDCAYSAVFHSDGTLTVADEWRLRHFFPNVRIVRKHDMDDTARTALAGAEFEVLRAFRDAHVFGPKLIDPHLSEQVETIILLDTDILFFRRPSELIDRCRRTAREHVMTASRDVSDAYVAELDVLRDRLEVNVAERLNAGLIVMPRFGRDDLLLLDRMLRKFEPAWRTSYFAEQTLYAAIAGVRGWHTLSDLYHLGRGHFDDVVSVHYASGLRQRLYTEGVPRLLSAIERGQQDRGPVVGAA